MATATTATAKIEKLTDAQEAVLPTYIEKWVKIGHSCEPCDFEAASGFARAAAVEAGLTPPEKVILTDSPWSAAVIAAIFQTMTEEQVDHYCSTPTKAQEELFPTYDPISHTYILDGKEISVGNKSVIADAVSAQMYGSHEAAWLVAYDFFGEEVGLEATKPLKPLIELAKVCGWWAAYTDLIILQHRHCELHRNDRGDLSNTTGLALKYRDGSGLWMIDGYHVDEQIVMRPETQTIEQIEAEQSADIKSVRISQYGWVKYLVEIKAKCLEKVHNEVEGTMEALFELPDGSRKLMATCPKGMLYVMGIDRSCDTCVEARAWLSPIAGFTAKART